MVHYLIFCFLVILFVPHLSVVYKSAVKKQFINCSLTKVKLSKDLISFAASLVFSLEPVLADEVWQASGQESSRQPSSPALPSQLDGGGCRGAVLRYICQLRTWTHLSKSMSALLVSTASRCVRVLRRQPETFLFRLIHFITFMAVKICSLSAPVLKGGVQDL